MSVISIIFAEVDARLGAVDGLGSYERMPAGDPDAFDALQVYDNGDEPSGEQETGATRLELQLTVEGFVEGHQGAAAHDRLTALHAKAVRALCGDPGSNLGGLVENIEIVGKRRVDIAEMASKRRLGFAQDFLIQYSTVRGDPDTFA